ncbi:hypothetical protein [Microbacterium rhizosphaerae]|uniref:Uncharacterized protein n=1 Tax=Microbacterium rhizosphaerae TaxID=1678237 RepID=A0ABZ0SVQ1_9MICO|nr:hypothetical protein [Microbacterium rhizosphaerae]WPR91327.1 hypothetical protein SM116_08640 [Microbacterium rhizosphaerae]
MGTNKRYASYYDRLGDERALASCAAKGGLQSLGERELDLAKELTTTDPEPKPVRAWVRFYDHPINVRALACRWTSRAIEVSFVAGGKEYKTWVWSNAVVEDREPRADPDKYGPSGQ